MYPLLRQGIFFADTLSGFLFETVRLPFSVSFHGSSVTEGLIQDKSEE
jgi:hypothetical protein